MYLHVSKQSIEIKQELNGIHFLYEEANQYLLNGLQEDGKKIKHGEDTYIVQWENNGKICIQYKNIFQKDHRICEILE